MIVGYAELSIDEDKENDSGNTRIVLPPYSLNTILPPRPAPHRKQENPLPQQDPGSRSSKPRRTFASVSTRIETNKTSTIGTIHRQRSRQQHLKEKDRTRRRLQVIRTPIEQPQSQGIGHPIARTPSFLLTKQKGGTQRTLFVTRVSVERSTGRNDEAQPLLDPMYPSSYPTYKRPSPSHEFQIIVVTVVHRIWCGVEG